ncbi:MAG: thioredoxin family protein [Candidatus Tectomicrobia bacterium]|uniref:Thioredoxin family protein n=1 Tax=Tectimicrobiota bacterium TaxID=2528274 RepID=A0A932HXV2_UNCTE|nr:thioredoxin family protein [Candidatus Tectomicrobia bacterium]
MKTIETAAHRAVSREAWLEARRALLDKEKDLTRRRDELSRRRRELPWVRVDKNYIFDAPDGKKSLADLFGGKSQIMIYHFMFGPDWEEGCRSCSFLSDHIDGANRHLPHRGVRLLAASRAPLAKIERFKKRMGWRFEWVSSLGSDFNFDYGVSFAKEDVAKDQVNYNYAVSTAHGSEELPGLSAFYKDPAGAVFHTYSAYARGLDMLIGAYNFLDLAPMGRDEEGFSFTMEWVRHHDRYGA